LIRNVWRSSRSADC